MKNWKAVAWFGLFGLLPLWISIGYVLLGSKGAPGDYWNVAPWLVVAGVFASAITLAIAGVTYLVYNATSGERERKIKLAAACLLVLTAAATFGGSYFRASRQQVEKNKEVGRELVRRSEIVRSMMPPEFDVSVRSTINYSDRPPRYIYRVHSPQSSERSLIVIADATEGAVGPTLTVQCILLETEYRKLPSDVDPCASNTALKDR